MFRARGRGVRGSAQAGSPARRRELRDRSATSACSSATALQNISSDRAGRSVDAAGCRGITSGWRSVRADVERSENAISCCTSMPTQTETRSNVRRAVVRHRATALSRGRHVASSASGTAFVLVAVHSASGVGAGSADTANQRNRRRRWKPASRVGVGSMPLPYISTWPRCSRSSARFSLSRAEFWIWRMRSRDRWYWSPISRNVRSSSSPSPKRFVSTSASIGER